MRQDKLDRHPEWRDHHFLTWKRTAYTMKEGTRADVPIPIVGIGRRPLRPSSLKQVRRRMWSKAIELWKGLGPKYADQTTPVANLSGLWRQGCYHWLRARINLNSIPEPYG